MSLGINSKPGFPKGHLQMRKIIATLAVMLSVAAAVPAFANSAVGSNPYGDSTYSASAGAGGR
jgi:hypothetical protein